MALNNREKFVVGLWVNQHASNTKASISNFTYHAYYLESTSQQSESSYKRSSPGRNMLEVEQEVDSSLQI